MDEPKRRGRPPKNRTDTTEATVNPVVSFFFEPPVEPPPLTDIDRFIEAMAAVKATSDRRRYS